MIVLVLAAALAAAAPTPDAPRELTLDEALALAARNQPSLAQANALNQAAEARAQQAFGPLLPQVSGNASYSFDNTELHRHVPLQLNPSYSHVRDWNAGIRVDQLLFDFGSTTNRYASASHSARSQEDNGRQTVVQVMENVRTTFFAARGQRALVQVAQQNLDSQTAHLRQIQGFVSVGARPEIDLSQGRANVANAQVQFITARNNYATAKAQLDRAMGLSEPFAYDVAEVSMPPVEGEDAPLPDLVNRAWRARPDTAAFDQQVDAARASAAAARGSFLPAIGANLALTQGGFVPGANTPTVTILNETTVLQQPLTTAGVTTEVTGGVTLKWSIFAGGTTRAQAAEADWQARALEAQKEGLLQDIRVQVEQAQLAIHADQQALVAAQEAATSANDRLRLAEGRYAAGVGTIIELSDAQSAQTSAQAQLVQAAYSLSTARAQLLFALGRP